MKTIKTKKVTRIFMAVTLILVMIFTSACSAKKVTPDAGSSGPIDTSAITPPAIENAQAGQTTPSLDEAGRVDTGEAGSVVPDDEGEGDEDEGKGDEWFGVEDLAEEEGLIGTAVINDVDCPLYLYDNLCYYIDNDHASVIFTFFTDDSATEYTVRSSIVHEGRSYPVTTICADAFYGFPEMTDITLPDSLTTIEDSAFAYCEALESITFPDSVTSLGDYVLGDCENLKSVVLPSGLTEFGIEVFFNDMMLTDVTLPDALKVIPESTFSGCETLASIDIPASVTVIGDEAFWYCEALTDISLPDGLVSIGDRCFYDCIALEEITLPASLSAVGEDLFDFCDALTTVNVPDSKVNKYSDMFEGYEFEVVGY